MKSIFFVGLIGVLVSGCREATVSQPPHVTTLDTSYVTGAIRAAIDQNGLLVLGDQAEKGEINDQQARELAVVWMRDYAPMVQTSLERERGRSINLRSLTPCGRVFRASSALEPTALPTIESKILDKSFGAQWLVSFCEGQVPVVSVSIAALATDLALVDGRISWPEYGGSEFFPIGIPLGTHDTPLAPEVAVTLASQSFGTKISQMPELVQLFGYAAQSSAWRIGMERDVDVRSVQSGRVRAVHEVFVGQEISTGRAAMFVASDSQPQDITKPLVGQRETIRSGEYHAKRIANLPLLFDEIRVPAATTVRP